MLGHPPYVWMMFPYMFRCPACLGAPYVWMHPECLDTPICLDAPICLDDVWIPPVHTQHKESMLCQTKGMSICPYTFGCPLYASLYVWTPQMFGCPVCLGAPMFGCPLYAWTPPYVWMTPYVQMMFPTCLDAQYVLVPHMFGCPLYVWTPPYVWMLPYVWMMFGCPLYIHNTKKACFVRLRGCPYAPIHLDAPICWMPPVCLDEPICLDTPCMFVYPTCLHTPICLDAHLYV